MKKPIIWKLAALAALMAAMVTGCGSSENAGEKEQVTENVKATTQPGNQVASEDEMTVHQDVVEEGMEPIEGKDIKDGVYDVKVDSSSSMFNVTSCELTVKDGEMTAVITMHGTGYLKLFMGTGTEAVQASEKDYIPYVENKNGEHTFEIPVEAMDAGIDCTAFSKNKEKWYDRVLVFRADSLPAEALEGMITTLDSLGLAEGLYTVDVTLAGGSGRAEVESPAMLRIEGGRAFATIVWGSSNYEYMKVDEQQYDLVNTDGNSTFEIPVSQFDWKMPVSASTTAMSTPHEIEYALKFDSASIVPVQ